MPSGYITSHIDVAQLVLYGFFIFFAGLIIYLRREDKREGYPLESDRSRRAPDTPIRGFPAPPPPKTFRMRNGEADVLAPRTSEPRIDEIAGVVDSWAPLRGNPMRPSGDPMRDGVGPASHAQRQDIPDLTIHGTPRIVPIRVATDFAIARGDPDPRGMAVVGADGVVAGSVSDVWVDRAEPRILFFEVTLDAESATNADSTTATTTSGTAEETGEQKQAATAGSAVAPGGVLLPVGFARIHARKRKITTGSILASQFAHVPGLASPDGITRLEEDRITSYFAGGHLYATPSRQEALI